MNSNETDITVQGASPGELHIVFRPACHRHGSHDLADDDDDTEPEDGNERQTHRMGYGGRRDSVAAGESDRRKDGGSSEQEDEHNLFGYCFRGLLRNLRGYSVIGEVHCSDVRRGDLPEYGASFL